MGALPAPPPHAAPGALSCCTYCIAALPFCWSVRALPPKLPLQYVAGSHPPPHTRAAAPACQDILAAQHACRKHLNVLLSFAYMSDSPDVPHRALFMPLPREVRQELRVEEGSGGVVLRDWGHHLSPCFPRMLPCPLNPFIDAGLRCCAGPAGAGSG